MNSTFRMLVFILLSLLFALSAFAAPMAVESFDTAKDVNESMDAALSEIVLDGMGTIEQPYIIASEQDYFEFCKKVSAGENSCHAILQADIDFGGTVIDGIGSKEIPFKGTFDGNGKTLNNFVVSGKEYIGVFNYIDSAVVKNLNIGTFDVDLSNSDAEKVYVGAIAYANNSTITKICVNNHALNLVGQTKYVYAGAVCGYGVSNSKGQTLVDNCYSICDISLVNSNGYAYVGGIVGRFVTDSGGYSIVNRCYNIGDISGDSKNSANVGGLVGYLHSHGSAYSPETGASLSADVDIMIKNSFAVSSVSAKSASYNSRVGKIVGSVNTYAACDNATTFYTNDSSVTVVGTAKVVGTQVTLQNLQNTLYIASNLGFDFASVWTDSSVDTYKYPVFFGSEEYFDADEKIDFLAVSGDVSVKSNGNVLTIDKIRIADGHKLTLDKGTYVIGKIEGTPVIEADIYANVIIGGENRPQNHVELNIGSLQNASNLRFVEINGNQYKIDAVGEKYGLLVDENTMVEIVEKVNTGTAAASSKYFIAKPDGTSSAIEDLNDYMTSTDTYGIRLIGNMGIRFKAEIDANKKMANENFEIVEYGYVLTLKKYLDASNGKQLNFDFDGKKVGGVAYNANDGTDLVFSTDNGIDAFTAVLYDIPKTGYKEDVVAKTYTKVSVDGNEYIIYGEEMVSNLYKVANIVDYDSLNDEQKVVIDGIINS